MPTVTTIEPDPSDGEIQEIPADPEVQAALEVLDDVEDREDLIDHLKVMGRISSRSPGMAQQRRKEVFSPRREERQDVFMAQLCDLCESPFFQTRMLSR